MRADLYLSTFGYVQSRQRAKQLIAEGGILIDGRLIKKASEEIEEGFSHDVTVNDMQKYVGRGGLKLEGAIAAFGLDVLGKRALDIGASTGGFTDCLLQHGAGQVVAVDAGIGQLAKKLCDDARVISKEHCNARDLAPADIGGVVDVIVMDVSFISATYIIPRFSDLLGEQGEAVCLIKPQFEVGKTMLGKGGIVKDPAAHRFAIDRVLASGREHGLCPAGLISSPIKGGDGNREFLVHFKKGDGVRDSVDLAYIRRIVGG